MIKQVYLVRYAERFGYADTLEEAKAMERRFELSYGSECFAASAGRNISVASTLSHSSSKAEAVQQKEHEHRCAQLQQSL